MRQEWQDRRIVIHLHSFHSFASLLATIFPHFVNVIVIDQTEKSMFLHAAMTLIRTTGTKHDSDEYFS